MYKFNILLIQKYIELTLISFTIGKENEVSRILKFCFPSLIKTFQNVNLLPTKCFGGKAGLHSSTEPSPKLLFFFLRNI